MDNEADNDDDLITLAYDTTTIALSYSASVKNRLIPTPVDGQKWENKISLTGLGQCIQRLGNGRRQCASDVRSAWYSRYYIHFYS